MLVLSRKVGTQIIVAGNIEIKVLGISGNSVSLGITAPAEISIVRREVHRSFDQSDGEANETASDLENQN